MQTQLTWHKIDTVVPDTKLYAMLRITMAINTSEHSVFQQLITTILHQCIFLHFFHACFISALESFYRLRN